MALKKRGKTWHCHFVVNGQRFRQSLATTDWREAQAKQKELIAAAEQGKLSASSGAFAKLLFEDAAEKYLAGRLPELAESSQIKERQMLVKVTEYFRGRRLRDITAETGVIRRMLKRAKRWSAIADDIRPLKEPRSIGRALTYEQKVRLLHAANSNPEWQTARLAMTIALCTTMRGVELKNLHWQDVDLMGKSFNVRRSKTDAGLRSIPMNEDAYDAVMELWERAKVFGGTKPEHFLFPACEHGQIAPERHQKSWRTAWRKLTKAAGLQGFRFHDCRHHAITELAESQASDSTIMALAGHVSRKMLEHYSHVRQEAKREAVNVLSAKRPNKPTIGGYDTNRDTKPVQPEQMPPYVIENMVGTRRLELLTSTVSR
jgi:integrase